MDTKRDILGRVYLSFICIALLGVFVMGRAVYIQRVEGDYWRAMSDSIRKRIIKLDAQRGTIYAEGGELLSTSVPTFDLYFDFQAEGLLEKKGKRFHEKIDSFAQAMSAYFGDRTSAEYSKDFKEAYKRGDRYYTIKKKLSFQQYKVFRAFPLVNLGRNRSGLIVQVGSKRLVPYGMLASRTVGLSREYVLSKGKIKKQNVGLEKSYDSLLSGRDGQQLVRYVAPGAALPIEGTETEPINGKDIYTTLDLTIQDITENALLRKMEQSQALYGTAIVMETSTGKIKAMANLGRRPDGSYWEDDNYALRTSEPGSTIKLSTLLAVLSKGSSRIDETVEIGSSVKAMVGPRMVTDAERSPRSFLTVKECFAHSSNIGMSKLALKAFGQNPTEILKYLHQFHMDERVAIDLSDVSKPYFTPLNEKGSSVGNMLSMSFGYGLQVSPLNTLTLYNAVANQGRMMKPYLVNSIRQGGIVYRQFEPKVLENVIAPAAVIASAREAMEAVVTEGTARVAFKGLPFAVAGKTGTAHVSDGPIKYPDGVYQASFVGYFPAERPQYTCIVVIRTRPHVADHFGGTLAAPVFREIATQLYSLYVESPKPNRIDTRIDSSRSLYAGDRRSIEKVYITLGISRTDSTQGSTLIQVRAANGQNQWVAADNTSGTQMPDLRGMSLKDALARIEHLRLGITIEIKGKGKISGQSINPGTPLSRGGKLTLELS